MTISSETSWQLLTLSGDTIGDVDTATRILLNYLQTHPETSLGDIARVLQNVPRHKPIRRFIVCQNRAEALNALTAQTGRAMVTGVSRPVPQRVTFLFPGLGDQYVNMTAGLYRDEPRFRACIDRCSEFLIQYLGVDLREIIYNHQALENGSGRDAAVSCGLDFKQMAARGASRRDLGRLKETALAQPALFMIEYALAELWRAWGIQPAAMAGYSLGEYVAATQAGVFSLEEGLQLVALRANLIGKLPDGAMLAVGLAEEAIQPYLNSTLSLSAVNGPMMSVVAGPVLAIHELEKRLTAGRVACRTVETTHAFHSYMMYPATEPLRALLGRFKPNYPRVPYLSNVSGSWISPRQAADPDYWTEHMCKPVRFADALQVLWGRPNNILLEVGLGQTLAGLAMQHPARRAVEHPTVLSSLPAEGTASSDLASLLRTLGHLWLTGVPVEWQALHKDTPAAEPLGLIEELYGQPCHD